jgi:hypothetical protein
MYFHTESPVGSIRFLSRMDDRRSWFLHSPRTAIDYEMLKQVQHDNHFWIPISVIPNSFRDLGLWIPAGLGD